jgi:hypothetical protein
MRAPSHPQPRVCLSAWRSSARTPGRAVRMRPTFFFIYGTAWRITLNIALGLRRSTCELLRDLLDGENRTRPRLTDDVDRAERVGRRVDRFGRLKSAMSAKRRRLRHRRPICRPPSSQRRPCKFRSPCDTTEAVRREGFSFSRQLIGDVLFQGPRLFVRLRALAASAIATAARSLAVP